MEDIFSSPLLPWIGGSIPPPFSFSFGIIRFIPKIPLSVLITAILSLDTTLTCHALNFNSWLVHDLRGYSQSATYSYQQLITVYLMLFDITLQCQGLGYGWWCLICGDSLIGRASD